MTRLTLALRKTENGSTEYEVELIAPSYQSEPIPLDIPYDENNRTTKQVLKTLKLASPPRVYPYSLSKYNGISDFLAEKIGRPLFKALFQPKVLQHYRESLKKAKEDSNGLVVIQLDMIDPRLLNVPWEFMYDDALKHFLVLNGHVNISLSRLIQLDNKPEIINGFSPPLQVLLVISKPTTDREKYPLPSDAKVKNFFDKIRSSDELQVDYLERPASLKELKKKLKEKQYHILHFLGHGILDQGKGVLVFEDDQENPDLVTPDQLAIALIEQKKLHLIILSACLTGKNSELPFSSVATALLQKAGNVVSVVAMQFNTKDIIVPEFTSSFYDCLLKKKTVDEAMLHGWRDIYSSSDLDEKLRVVEWGVPAHYTSYEKPLRLIQLPAKNPYPGLRSFESKDKDYFCGRTREINILLGIISGLVSTQYLVPTDNHQKRPNLITVVGASGSGKSSLVKAGLIPILKKGGERVLDSKKWVIESMVPGSHPLDNLAEVFNQEVKDLSSLVRNTLQNKDQNSYFVLFIDQFEEVFTLCTDESERKFFLNQLLDVATTIDLRALIILTMRIDFYARFAVYQEANDITANQRIIIPMNEDELREAIESVTD